MSVFVPGSPSSMRFPVMPVEGRPTFVFGWRQQTIQQRLFSMSYCPISWTVGSTSVCEPCDMGTLIASGLIMQVDTHRSNILYDRVQ